MTGWLASFLPLARQPLNCQEGPSFSQLVPASLAKNELGRGGGAEKLTASPETALPWAVGCGEACVSWLHLLNIQCSLCHQAEQSLQVLTYPR